MAAIRFFEFQRIAINVILVANPWCAYDDHTLPAWEAREVLGAELRVLCSERTVFL